LRWYQVFGLFAFEIRIKEIDPIKRERERERLKPYEREVSNE